MTSFELETLDGGRLIVNRAFLDGLRAAGLTSFEAVMNYRGGSVAKDLLRERITTRIPLPEADGGALYLKRHAPPPLREYVKPWFRFTRPILGAANEWTAILEFHHAGIATMTPVALGRCGRRSFLLTESIEGCRKLSDWFGENGETGALGDRPPSVPLLRRVGETARRMHEAGLHHQDFYLTHLMVPENDPASRVYVIDLGRARRRRRLRQRWVVKDLAQLSYSARRLPDDDRRAFLEAYFGRPLRRSDGPLLRRIARKTEAIARHSRKNRL